MSIDLNKRIPLGRPLTHEEVDANWEEIEEALNSLTPGVDGREIELQKSETHIQWRYEGDEDWTNLVALSELKGDAGDPGTPGTPGEDGNDGADGREIELQKSATHIQWRYVGEGGWTNLVALSELKGDPGTPGTPGEDGDDGADGREIELQKSATHIQWRYAGDVSWTNLVALSELKGDPGDPGGSEIEVTVSSTQGTVAKVGTTSAGNYTPTVGDKLLVTFTNGQTANNITLNIDGSGAIQIRLGNLQVTNATCLLASGDKIPLFYDGTYYRLYGSTQNTTYSEITTTLITHPTSSSASLISGRRMQYYKEQIIDPYVESRTNRSVAGSLTTNGSDLSILLGSGVEFRVRRESLSDFRGEIRHPSQGYTYSSRCLKNQGLGLVPYSHNMSVPPASWADITGAMDAMSVSSLDVLVAQISEVWSVKIIISGTTVHIVVLKW